MSSDWDWDLGPGTWDLGIEWRIENQESRIENQESRIENRESRIENRNYPVPVLTVKSHDPPTTHPPPTTFRGEGDKLQQSAFSKNVLG